MKDRTPKYPGRVRLTPVSGQTNVYDMTREDQPTQAGTPICKATMLRDTTASLFGLGDDAVPDDVFNAIKTLIDGANANADSKLKSETGSYVGTGKFESSNPNSLTFKFAPKLLFVFALGTVDSVIVQTGAWFPVLAYTSTFKEYSYFYNDFNSKSFTYAKISGNTVSWYNATSDKYQLNTASVTYHYIAIG